VTGSDGRRSGFIFGAISTTAAVALAVAIEQFNIRPADQWRLLVRIVRGAGTWCSSRGDVFASKLFVVALDLIWRFLYLGEGRKRVPFGRGHCECAALTVTPRLSSLIGSAAPAAWRR
jgi:hypothetical protein